MINQLFLIFAFSAFSIIFYKYSSVLKKIKIAPIYLLSIIIFIGFIYRVNLAPDTGFGTDISLFTYWSNSAYDLGMFSVYDAGFFLDYPPGYIYILYFVNWIADLFNIDTGSQTFVLLLKMPSIIADLVSGVVIYNISKKYQDEYKALVLSAMYILAPAVIFNSAVWGQIDSYYSLLVVLSIYFAMQDKVKTTAIIYGIALATKPQSLLFGPILLFYIIEKKDFKKLVDALFYGLLSFYILTIPISKGYDLLAVIQFYLNTFSGYKSITVNAFNIYALLGLNWKPLSEALYGEMINTIVIPMICLLVGYYFFTNKNKEKYLVSANIIIILFFSFCTMMHERYIFPALLISILLAGITGKMKYLILYLLVSAFSDLNVVHIYEIYNAGASYLDWVINLSAIILLIIAIYQISFIDFKELKNVKIKPVYLLSVLIFFISALTFYNLGNNKTPQSFYQSIEYGEQFSITFDEKTTISEVYYYMGMGDEYSGDETPKITSDFSIFYLDDLGTWQFLTSTKESSVFSWRKAELQPVSTNSVAIVANDKNQTLSELIFLDEKGEIITFDFSYDYEVFGEYPPANLFNEAYMFTKDLSYYSSSYFDEIYFGRTAYELTQDYSIYETTHPHLGKYLISIGIMIFGMNPFGFRFMGAVFGILIVLAVFFLAKELFKNSKAGLIAAFLSAFDCMRFTQSRISTSDSFLVFFMISTFIFMLKYKNLKDDKNLNKAFLYLFLSGVFMALTVSVKWNGAYAMVGLAVLFFYILYLKYKNHKDIKIVYKTIAFCFLAFVIIPVLIYFILFTPVLIGDNLFELIKDFIRWQTNMFDYHSQLVSEHFFASPWYTWFFVEKPIWFSVDRTGDLVSCISSFGNIAIWWAMPFSMVYLAYKSFKEKDSTAVFILVSYLMCILPWILISRETFIYHYYPATIFGILAISYILNSLLKNPKNIKYVYAYLLIVFITFMVFAPVAGGFRVSASYADSLELFDNWYFN